MISDHLTSDRKKQASSLRQGLGLASRVAALLAMTGFLSACQDSGLSNTRAYRPIPQETLDLMASKGTSRYAPVLIRTFKKEAEFEIWKQRQDGHYVLLKTYPMCRWSGQLGPKTREGDRQVPEGFYAITPGQMNPNSNYYLSFNVGYPNAYDKAHNYSGGLIMVHGACSSAGCFSMTDEQISEIYAIAREGFAGGQREIQMQSLPFRMNADNLAKFRLDPNLPFWKELKKGADQFEVSQADVKVGVCNRHYVFGAEPATPNTKFDATGACPPLKEDPTLAQAVAERDRADETQVAELVAKGVKPIRLIYADGGQHPDFAARPGDVSRPDALAQGPTEIALDDKKPVSGAVRVAAGAAAGQAAANALAANRMAASAPVAGTTAVSMTAMPQSQSTAAPGGMINRYNAPVVASTASGPAAAPAPTASGDGPFYKKIFSFGASEQKPVEPPAPVGAEPVPVPAAPPVPPRRADVKPQPTKPTPAPAPQASAKPRPAPNGKPDVAVASQTTNTSSASTSAADRQAVLRSLPSLGGASDTYQSYAGSIR